MEKKSLIVKKRENERANEVIKDSVKVIDPRVNSYGDRFIPRRYNFNDNRQVVEKLYTKSEECKDVIKSRLQTGYWMWDTYRFALNKAMGIKPSRILQFTDVTTKSNPSALLKIKAMDTIYANKKGLDWPCNPRNRPLGFADSTHDLPGFSLYSGFNIIAWSSRGLIAASFGSDLVLWSPEKDETNFYGIQKSKAIAFNPQGDIMAAGCERGKRCCLQLWNIRNLKNLQNISEFEFKSKTEEIRCIEWELTGQILLCGNSTGKIVLFTSPKLEKIKEINNHKLAISSLKFSPKGNYLASNDIEGNVYIINWPSCAVHVRLASQRKLRTVMAWHPWNGTDLIICENYPAAIVVLNVIAKEIVAYWQRKDYNCSIDAVSFNKLSGELVVSCTIRGANQEESNEIMVMASLDRIVDTLKAHEDSVKFLLWSPDNLLLATAGDDETLTIWNFFGNDKNQIKNKLKKKNEITQSANSRTSQFADILNTYVKHSKRVGKL